MTWAEALDAMDGGSVVRRPKWVPGYVAFVPRGADFAVLASRVFIRDGERFVGPFHGSVEDGLAEDWEIAEGT